MRPVGAEQHVVRSQRVDQLVHVVFGEGADPQVPGEGLARAGWQLTSDHGPAPAQCRRLVHGLEQRLQPAGAVLDGQDPHAGVAAEQVVQRDRDESVDERALGVAQRPLQRDCWWEGLSGFSDQQVP